MNCLTVHMRISKCQKVNGQSTNKLATGHMHPVGQGVVTYNQTTPVLGFVLFLD